MCTISSWALEKALPWLQRAVCVSSFLSCLPVFVVLSCLSCLMFREVSCFQGRCSHSFICKNWFHPESSNQGMAKSRFTFCCYPIFFKRGTGNMVSNYIANKQPRGHLFPCNLVFNLQSQQRAHLYVEIRVTDG